MKRTIPLVLTIGTLICVNVIYVVKADELRQQQEELTIEGLDGYAV